MSAGVDIVIPVYNAADDARICVESVLRHTDARHRVVVIDDASPDPRVAELVAELGARGLPQLVLLANAVNRGFTATANRGMSLSRNDVVLLNSDTIVSPGWLDALVRCAESDPRIGTITPFSNNAEILSFPHFCVNNAWPAATDPTAVARAIAGAAVPSYPDIPTGVGFCLFIRRALVDDIGRFDMAFGAGYGEENDFCLRAAAHGWRNVLADDAFVAHTGGRSFTTQKAVLVERNARELLARHPGYDAMIQRYVASDPLRAVREAARTRLAMQGDTRGGVLHVIHHHGGGTESHVRQLIDASRGERRHFLAVAVGDAWQVEEHRADGEVVSYALQREASESWPRFVDGICATFGIGVIHLHNISACRDGLLAAMTATPLPFGYTVHDVNFACPTITFLDASGRFCGAVTDPATCRDCLARQRDFDTIDIVDWRARHQVVASRAAFLIAPSDWAADTFARYFGRRPAVIAHGSKPDADDPPPPLLPLPQDGAKVVAVLGAVGPDKGARRLEQLVDHARSRKAPVRFVLVGYLDREQGPWQSDDKVFTVHARYRAGALSSILRGYGVDLVLFPSAGPETFSYTLSEAWSAGLSVLVPPIGALAERVIASGAGHVMTAEEWQDTPAMFSRIQSLLGGDERHEREHGADRARSLVLPPPASMARATLALYDSAQRESAASPVLQPLDARRVRDALGYVPWQPPLPPATALAARRSLRARVARAAMRMRGTRAGERLYRYLSPRLIDALKSRLR